MKPNDGSLFIADIHVEFNATSGEWVARIASGDVCHAYYSAQTPEEAVKGLRNQMRISHHKLTTVPPKTEGF